MPILMRLSSKVLFGCLRIPFHFFAFQNFDSKLKCNSISLGYLTEHIDFKVFFTQIKCFGLLNPNLLEYLKRQSHEIFDLHFFQKSMAPRALITPLKYFRILFRFRAEISKFVLTCIVRGSFSNFVSSKTSRYAT
jgi:hypothetical protein